MEQSTHPLLASNFPTEFLETFSNKLKVIAALTVPCLVSVVILVLNTTSWYSKSVLRDIVVHYHVFVAPVVQILSTVLASLQLYVVFAIFEYSARTRITRSQISLNTLRLWSALASRSLNFNLQFTSVLLLLGTIIIGAIPASIWAASITPQLSSASINDRNISLPVLGKDGFRENVNGNFLNHCLTMSSPGNGIFSSCPAKQFFSNIIFSGRSASAPSQNITRLDTTQNIYIGRSYGIGAAVGLTDSTVLKADIADRDFVTNYNYTELGFQTVISCKYLTSTPWQIISLQNGNNNEGVPFIYRAADLGNLGLGFYSTWSLGSAANIVAWTTNRPLNATQPAGIIYIAAGSQYRLLGNISCTVDFQPRTFGVHVDRIAKTIVVVPGANYTASLDDDFHLRNIAMQQLGIVSQVSTTLYFSAIGDSLLANMANSASLDSKEANLTTIADSFTAMLDALLLTLTSAQTQLPNFSSNSSLSQSVPVHLQLTVARIGNQRFIMAIVGLNAATVLVLLFFIFKTRFWRDLPRFSYLDVGSVIIASAVDGRGLKRDVHRATGGSYLTPGPWTGDSADDRVGSIRVGVGQRDTPEGSMLTLDSRVGGVDKGGQARDESHELLFIGQSSSYI